MIIECCSQERTYEKFFGLIGERLAKINLVWAKAFEQCFVQYYETIHRYETNRLRNVSKYFGHLLASDALSWQVFSVIKLTEDDTTSSSRIFVKILFEELTGILGLARLKERMMDGTMLEYYVGLFPKDNPRNTRFAINYFTSIGLGILTDELREHLQNAAKISMTQKHALESDSEEDSDSSTSSDSSTESTSSSDSSSVSSSSSAASSSSSSSASSSSRSRSRSRHYHKRSRRNS